MKTVCGICTAEYDDQMVSHRQGPDCARRVRQMVDDLSAKMMKLQRLFQDHSDTENIRESDLGKKMESIADGMGAIDKRISDMGKRVTLLEHPKMEKVNAMKRD